MAVHAGEEISFQIDQEQPSHIFPHPNLSNFEPARNNESNFPSRNDQEEKKDIKKKQMTCPERQ